MRQLSFYGCSDDLFEIEGTTGKEPDEIGSFNSAAVVRIDSSEGSLAVVGIYAPENLVACWSIGLMQIDEDIDIPKWPMEWGVGGRGYSVKLTIQVPDDAVVSDMTKETVQS